LIVSGASILSIILLSACLRSLLPFLRSSFPLPARIFIIPFVAFAGIYLVLVVARGSVLSAQDRYLIPVLPLTILLALIALQKLGIRSPSALSVISLCIFSAWGLAST